MHRPPNYACPGAAAGRTVPRGQRKNTDTVYPDHEQLIQDIAVAYRTVIQELYAAGCRNIQFDDCTWGMIGDPNYQNFLKESNTKVEDVAAEYLRLTIWHWKNARRV